MLLEDSTLKISPQKQLRIMQDDGRPAEVVNLDDVDPIFAASFSDMIHEAFSEGKHFVLARIQTKQEQGDLTTVNHNFYYNAQGILRLLFQKKNGVFVGRFHEQWPITCKNPVTNSRIIGEVEFYLVRNQRLEQATLVADRANQALQQTQNQTGLASGDVEIEMSPMKKDDPLNRLQDDTCSLEAEFTGTDFNFLYSEEMQQVLFQNCLDSQKQHLLQFGEYQESEELRNQMQFGGLLDLNFDQNMNNVVQSSFDNTNKFIRMGRLNFLFYFCAGFTLISSGLSLIIIFDPSVEHQKEEQRSPDEKEAAELQAKELQIKLFIFNFLMPISAFFYHHELQRVCQKKEIQSLHVLKYVLSLLFYAVLIYAVVIDSFFISNLVLFTYSGAIMTYTYCIFNWTKFQVFPERVQDELVPDRNGAAAQVGIPTELVLRQHLNQDNVQVAFDQVNFAGGLAEAGQQLAEADISPEQEQQMQQRQDFEQQG